MTKKAEQGEATPAVVPGYGEADGEAASMDKAAHKGKAKAAATEVGAQPVPDSAGPVGYGTSETDVKKRIAEITSRKAAKPDAAG